MATQRELIYSVKNILRGGQITDDDAITDRQVAFLIDGARAVLLRQQYNKGQNISDNNIQAITCLEMTQVDSAFMSDFPSGCIVQKSVRQLPKMIESKGKDLLTGITGPNLGAFTYEYIPYARLPYASFTRFKRPLASLFNGHLYLINAPFTYNVTVTAVFEQPNEIAEYDSCTGTPCFDWDSQYPMSSHLIDPVIKMVVEELSLTIRVFADRTNTGAHELESQLNTNIAGKIAGAMSSSKKSSD
jgi:hypothetical protein